MGTHNYLSWADTILAGNVSCHDALSISPHKKKKLNQSHLVETSQYHACIRGYFSQFEKTAMETLFSPFIGHMMFAGWASYKSEGKQINVNQLNKKET